MLDHSIIAAIATGMTPSGVGIIRVSGEGSIDLCDCIFRGKNSLAKQKSHTMWYGHIVNQTEVLDEVLVSIMRAPHSYTMEDVVEINCHGGPFVLKKVLDLLYEKGARPANPGEFTMRAFLNGRLDLSQAESVMEMISSENEFSLQNALRQLSGSFSQTIEDIRDQLLYEIAYIETALDDPEHFSLEFYSMELKEKIEILINRIQDLIDTSKDGSILKNGIQTAILGQVNVGKSSLLNALSGWEKAIVTNIPGTTRDMVEESIRLGEVTLRMIDTAGIRESVDPVEQIGIENSKRLMQDAALILYIIDASTEYEKNDQELLKEIEDKKVIVCLNKADLPQKTRKEQIDTNHPIISISAKNRNGFKDLTKAVTKMFFENNLNEQKDFYITNERHKYLLLETKKSLSLVLDAIEQGLSEDFLSIDLTDAYETLGKIIGKKVEDDVVETIFSKFCIGK